MQLPDRGDDMLYDTLMYAGVLMIAFGLGFRMDTWLANDAYLAPVLYTAIILFVYKKWVLSQHK